jgi:uncharacterized membrane protein
MPVRIAIFFHLLGFAAYAGAEIAHQRVVRLARAGGAAGPVRAAYEALAAALVSRVELPALLVSLASGVALLYEQAWGPLRQGWMHGKLAAVLALLVLAHLEMFNAKRMVRARTARGDAADDENAQRLARQARFGCFAYAGIITVIAMVAFVR